MKTIERIVNVETQEIIEIERDLTPEELQKHNDYLESLVEAHKVEEEKAAQKAALLAKLGITADEAKLLLA